MSRFVWRSLAAASLFAFVAACGGGGEPSGPPAVATVTVSAFATDLIVGQSLQVAVTALDAKGNAITDRPITYQSSAPEIASVSATGSVLGVSPGAVTITASVGGRSGTVALTVKPVPVAGIIMKPRNVAIRAGETTTLVATPVDITNAELSGRTVTWTSADPTRATVNASGVVTAVAPGSVYIRAQVETVSDSALVRVRNLNAPSITGAAPALLLPSTTGTVSGANFSNASSDVVVLVNGVPATVTAATTSSVSFTVPAASQLPCSATGKVPLAVVVNGDTATFNHPLQMATQRTLTVGQSLLLTAQNDIACNEVPQDGGHYIFTVFNTTQLATSTSGFRVDGNTGTGTGPAVASRAPVFARMPAPTSTMLTDARTTSLSRLTQAAHERVMDLNDRVLRAHPHPLQNIRAYRNANVAKLSVQAALPNVGDMTTLRIINSLSGSLSQYAEVRARAVYVGTKMIIYEDSLAPLARTMDQDFVDIGQEFDTKMFPVLSNFGDPLVLDSQTDNNGRIIALFSKRVNDLSSGLLGFVGSWDFFPQSTDPNVGFPASNFGEYFYAAVPDPASNIFPDAATWKRFLRGVLAHEAKHIVGFATRIALDASRFEERWLEEATAQLASEMWARDDLYHSGWKRNIAWLDGPRCDYVRTLGGSCADNARGIALHYDWLYTFFNGNERRSFISNSSSDGSTLYGGAWLFMRWLVDTYGGATEATFTRALIQQKDDAGITNIQNRTGRTFEEMLGLWSLTTVVDDLAGFTPSDTRLAMPSWNVHDMFAGMNTLKFTDGSLAYPRVYPLNVRALSYGDFAQQSTTISGLPGGGFVAFELSGTQTGPQTIAVRDQNGGLPPGRLGLAIVRVP